MEKILVTGAGGFIGSHLCQKLVEDGNEVTALVRYNSKNNWGWLETLKLGANIKIITGDIRDYDSVYNAMKNNDTVFHLAALIGIPYSYESPLAYIKTNIEGAFNILQSARILELKNVVITSTSETYGTAQYIPIDEKHPVVGQSPYSASKIAADQLAISYYRAFGTPVKIVRPFNTFGPRQSARAVIPTVITQLLESKPLKLGNLDPTRDFTFVKDTVEGFLEISNTNSLNGEVTNIGMNDEISVGEVAKKIAGFLGSDLKIDIDNQRVRPEKSEVERLVCDNSKIVANTNWKTKYDLDKGLIETIEWFKENRKLYKSEIYNV